MKFQRNLPVLSVAVPDAPLEYEPTMPTEALASPGLSLKQVFSMLWAHRMLSAAIMVAIVVPTGLFAKFLLPKTYLATATLVVNYSVNDPLAANNTNAALMANYMSTRIQLMQSSEVLMPVIDKLDLTKDKEYVAGFSGDPNALRDYVKEGLSRNLDIEQGAFGSQLLNVTASARDPIKAAKIANTLSEIYAAQELARQTGPATERALRYAEQLAELKNKVNLAQEQVTAFRQRTGVTTDLAAQNNTEAELLTTLEQRLQEAQTQRRSAEVKAVTDQNGGSSFTTSVVVQGLRTQIATLESQLAQYSSTLGTQNPKVIQLQLQLAATRKSLANELQTYSSSASSDLNASRQLEAKLQGAVDQQRAKVLTVRRQQEEGTKYVLELESAQTVYKRALDGYDEIMFASGGHSTNVSFVSRAVPPLRAAKPNKMKIFLMSVVAGLGLGLALPMGYEMLFDRRIRCADDMERSFDIPVLAELDAIPELGQAA